MSMRSAFMVLFALLLGAGCTKVDPVGKSTSQLNICCASPWLCGLTERPVRCPSIPMVGLASPPEDLATPDLATPDLATPDLTTPPQPDLATATPPPDMSGGQLRDMTNPVCIGNGLRTWWPPMYPLNNPACGADCGPTCLVGNGCKDASDCGKDLDGWQLRCDVDILQNGGTSWPLLYCKR
jgi:hypothetical protein